VVFGGPVPDEDVEQVRKATDADVDVAWIRGKMEEVKALGGTTPDVIAPYLKRLLKGAGL